ncbi:hypothetical protein [Streptomyces sp. Midd1]|uniref:hypothetical protein n=1 Tax=Streptomyces sp. Midd3 TaxID=3161191 RepID=UPI0034DB3989
MTRHEPAQEALVRDVERLYQAAIAHTSTCKECLHWQDCDVGSRMQRALRAARVATATGAPRRT